ncbi:hypothetical protein AA637_15210 [Cyanobacterium sp. HL-69]|uniref:hypothetical protein n=1 Tax=Cyanobacterium sp. HL-69 TaxID=2054282 RepID=UPI000CA1179C|nr:hypothetical protein AA637_15210 [Cyanobacterium sp. HL-69]
MQVTDRKINVKNSTLNILIMELKKECQNMISLINQLQLSDLSDTQKGEILANLLASSIHVHSHCDEEWQNLISDELQTLRDDI